MSIAWAPKEGKECMDKDPVADAEEAVDLRGVYYSRIPPPLGGEKNQRILRCREENQKF